MSTLRVSPRWTSLLVVLALACSADRALAPAPIAGASASRSAGPSVRVSEFHYDNSSTDAGEAIEISGPAGTNLLGWRVVRYNGGTTAASAAAATLSGAAGNPTITGIIPQSCGTRGVLVFDYPSNGIENGPSDGFALVNPTNQVVELLSFEGVLTVAGAPTVANPAGGMTSVDVGVSEPGNVNGTSIKRQVDGTWTVSAPSSFGTCNDDDSGEITPPPPVVASILVEPASATVAVGATQLFTATARDASNTPIAGQTFGWSSTAPTIASVNASGLARGESAGDATITAVIGSISGSAALHVNAVAAPPVPDIRFSEIHYDNVGTDAAETIEIEGPVGTSLAGYSIQLYNGSPTSTTTALKVYATLPVTGALAAPITCGARGVISIVAPSNPGIQNGGTGGTEPDGFALVDNNGQLVEFLSYEGSFVAADGAAVGVRSTDIGVMEDSPVPEVGLSLHRSDDGRSWTGPSASDMGYVNHCGAPPPASVTFSGRSATADPPLPVGFEGQIFATERIGGAVVTTTFTWTSETPAVASIDEDGVLRALSGGTATFRATATDGATATFSLPMVAGTQSTAPYGGNTEFGDPVDETPADDFIIRRREYTSSWNGRLGRPNWVSEKLDVTTYGPEDRCNCFTFDPELIAAGFTRYTTADYTGAGAFAGYGIDRGHMTRSADRTAANLDNARTYYFSNVLPQAAANNQVTWKILEDSLGALAEKWGKQVYVISGGSSGPGFPSKGYVKGENTIEMPGAVWKVALVLDHGEGLADVHSVYDVNDVIAVIMPNDPSVNPDWKTYKTTVNAVEALSGYDLLSLLQDQVEIPLEANDKPPVAGLAATYSGVEGTLVAFDAGASTDPDGDALSYAWNFGDGTMDITNNPRPTHVYADNGTYTVTVTVRDPVGAFSTASAVTTITNVAPTVTFGATTPLTILSGQSVGVAGSFTDPGADAPWSYRLDWGMAGAVEAGAFAASGAGISSSRQYLEAGQYSVTFTVTDKDGAATSRSVIVRVARVQIDGAATPRAINRNDNGGGMITVRLSSRTIDVGTIDASSIRIGNVAGVRDDAEKDKDLLTVKFSRQALIDAGVLQDGIAQLEVHARLISGVQIVAFVPVNVH